MTRIFISYRRSDDPYAARGINNALCKQFGKRNVYFDLDAIQAGLDYRKQIDDMIAECDVMLVVIGDKWLQLDESDRSRLEDKADLVSLEISSALKRDIPVIPVLVGSAMVPDEEMLPESVSSLVYRQAVEVRATANFDAQIENLLRNIAAVAPSGQSGLRKGVYTIAAVAVVTAIAWQAWQPLMDWASRDESGNTNAVDIAKTSSIEPAKNEEQLADTSEPNQGEPAISTQEQIETEPVEDPYEGIKITSQPPGANIFIDGELAGITPASLKNYERSRTATIRLQLEGYEPGEQVFTAPDKGLGDVSFTLQEIIKKFSLTINPEPANASVSILNIEPQYQRGMMLEPGRYHIEVSRAGYIPQRRWLELVDGNLDRDFILNALKTNFADGEVFRDCDDCPEMVVIPAGSFQMGSIQDAAYEDERPVHQVSIPRFAIGKFEITFGQFERFADSGHSSINSEVYNSCYPYWGGSYQSAIGFNFRNPGWPQTPDMPAVCVNFHDAKNFVKWLAETTNRPYRLPSEAELEYVNRAGSSTRFPWGKYSDDGCHVANVLDATTKTEFPNLPRTASCSDGHVFSSPVGSLAANAFGLHDTSGNIWEWAEDCWHDDYSGENRPDDGAAWYSSEWGERCGMGVVRGGNWYNSPAFLRSSNRTKVDRQLTNNIIGFRIAVDLPD